VAAGSLSDLLGGRVLAWLGGAALLVGIVLFLALAVAHGWIGEESRVILAGAASSLLMVLGIWLHGHRGRTEAAIVLVATGTAGLFATMIVAGEVYRLMAPLMAVAGCMIVGAAATTLAIRWAGRAIGALGLGGALLSPMLVGAPSSAPTLAILAVAAACSMWVSARRGWRWLGLATVVLCAPQWAEWVLRDQAAGRTLAVLACFGGIGLAGAMAADLRSRAPAAGASSSSTGVLALNACLLAVIGYLALHRGGAGHGGELWLAGLAVLHAGLGLRRGRPASSRQVRQVLVTLGVILADVAFGLSAHGLVLAIGWGGGAVACAWLGRRRPGHGGDQALLGLGVGAHLALVLLQALLEAPPGELPSGRVGLVALLSVAVLAASSLACARLSAGGTRAGRDLLDAVGLLAVAYLTAGALDGAALVGAWALEGMTVITLARRPDDDTVRLVGLGFLGGAVAHVLAVEAPPAALLTGPADLGQAAIALGSLAGVALRAGWHEAGGEPRRSLLIGAGAGALLYLASIAVVGFFQPSSVAAIHSVLDLGVRQQGQVLLSALWSLVGLAALTAGLRRRVGAVRGAGLALLLISVGKVFLYDLATLDSVYRVASFVVLGVLLLTGAFLYQRLRPEGLAAAR
jgi:uncharacterized membrane protein